MYARSSFGSLSMADGAVADGKRGSDDGRNRENVGMKERRYLRQRRSRVSMQGRLNYEVGNGPNDETMNEEQRKLSSERLIFEKNEDVMRLPLDREMKNCFTEASPPVFCSLYPIRSRPVSIMRSVQRSIDLPIGSEMSNELTLKRVTARPRKEADKGFMISIFLFLVLVKCSGQGMT